MYNKNGGLNVESIKNKLDEFLLKVEKPARYTGGELNAVYKNKENVNVRFAFCFPDTYEVGMSHLGLKILYGLKNSVEDFWCERVFCPWPDMEEEMRKRDIPLYGLESFDPIKEFDFVGFTLQYEMSYTNILNMLDLAQIPLLAKDRNEDYPIVVAGGPCAYNPEPLADFFDIFIMGEGEEVNIEIMQLYKKLKQQNKSKDEFLKQACQIQGVYVPKFYKDEYNDDKTLKGIKPLYDFAPEKIKKRIIKDLDKVFYPDNFVVPFVDTVHDRTVMEIFRGCIRGCRFCQAGYIYRPVREKSSDTVNKGVKALCENTGYDEISLSSLSSSDYTKLDETAEKILSWAEKDNISLSLPSLRVDNFSTDLMEKVQKVRKSGLTFAPEAGTQRLRDVINKNVYEDELMKTTKLAFNGGWNNVKLYFMLGLPTETMEDVEGIADLGMKVVDNFFEAKRNGNATGRVNVTVSTSSFVPKPFTPFQWAAQDKTEILRKKQKHLKTSIKSKMITYNYHDSYTSFLEAVFARGDRRLCKVLKKAFELGCKFDGWSEYFKYDLWMKAFEDCGIDPEFYAYRVRGEDEVFPWDHIDIGVSKKFLLSEYKKALNSVPSPNCREKCLGCGANMLVGGKCFND